MLEELRGAIYLAAAATIKARTTAHMLEVATEKHNAAIAEKERAIEKVQDIALTNIEHASVAKSIENINSKMSPEQRIYHEGH